MNLELSVQQGSAILFFFILKTMENPNYSLDIQCANCKHVIAEETESSFCKSCDDEEEVVNEPAPRYGFTKDLVWTDLNGLQNENS